LYPDRQIEDRKLQQEVKSRNRAEKDKQAMAETLRKWDREDTVYRLSVFRKRLKWSLPIIAILIAIGASGGLVSLAIRFGGWVYISGIIVLGPAFLLCFINIGMMILDTIHLLWINYRCPDPVKNSK
jgi:hypothetical protein